MTVPAEELEAEAAAKEEEEIQEVDRKLRGADTTEEQIPILQGRNSFNCQRYELVAKAQEKGFEPSACCHRTLSSGEEVFCPFYGKCSTDPTQYLANQSEVKHANEFADCDALVILGREQPNVEDMEAVAKAIWYDTDKPLRLSTDGYYLKVLRPYLMLDGSKVRGEVMVHRDPRVQAVPTACRENELIQALDRARLIWGKPKVVYILCDIPLPGVEIDRLVPWDVLRGADRLSKAIDAQAARGKRALPLSARQLAKTFPEPGMWETEKAAERWLENSPEIKDLRKNPHLSNRLFLLGNGGF